MFLVFIVFDGLNYVLPISYCYFISNVEFMVAISHVDRMIDFPADVVIHSVPKAFNVSFQNPGIKLIHVNGDKDVHISTSVCPEVCDFAI
jgi:hypothetical protein